MAAMVPAPLVGGPAVGVGVATAAAPAVGGAAPGPAVVAAAAGAAARQARLDHMTQVRERRKELMREQRDLAAEARKEQQAHQRAVKKMRTLPTDVILQCLRERGVAV